MAGKYKRNCPLCHSEVFYKSKAGCSYADQKKQICRKCYDSRRREIEPNHKLVEDLTGLTFNINRVLGQSEKRSKNGQRLWITECTNCGHCKDKLAEIIKNHGGCRSCSGVAKGYTGMVSLFNKYSLQAGYNKRTFDLSLEQFQELTSSKCHYCGAKPLQLQKTNNSKSSWGHYLFNGIDRKDNSVGYTRSNCVACCGACNYAKKTQCYNEFVKWLDTIAKFRFKPIVKMYVLHGPIASGKSTYSKNAAKHGFLCVNDDAIVNLLHSDDYLLYDKELKILYKTIENTVIQSSLIANRSVVIDRGLNVSIQGRKRWIALARSFDVSIEAICFSNEGPEIHARRRASSDCRGYNVDYWLKVAKHHESSYAVPSKEEGFDAVHYITWDEIQKGKVIV